MVGPGRWTVRVVGLGALWVLGACVVGTWIRLVDGPVRHPYADLVLHGVPVTGTVTALGVHGAIFYSFPVNGSTFQGQGHDDLQPVGRSRRAGDAVQVVYDVRDPTRSCACSPANVVAGHSLPTDLGVAAVLAVLPVALVGFRVSRRQRWWTQEWTGWPVLIPAWARRSTPRPSWRTAAARTDPFPASPETGGLFGVAPGRTWFRPTPGQALTASTAPAVVHTRRRIPLVGDGRHQGVYLTGNPLYGDPAVIWVQLPDHLHVDDVARLLDAAGFEVLRVRGPAPLAGLLTELPATVREQVRTSPELWA